MPDGIGYLTPDYDGNASLECLRLTLPSYLWRFVHGALGELTESSNWVQFGDLTPDDMVSLFTDALDNMRDCRMIGQVIMLATSQLPEGVLLCDGAEYSKDDYPELYEVLYPTLLGRDTFNTPDLRDRFVLCEGVTPFGETGGESEHELDLSEIPSHTHTYTPPTMNIDIEGAGAPDLLAGGIGLPTQTDSTGGSQPHNNMPPYYALIFGIVAK
jgi:microcystin-dependent protein